MQHANPMALYFEPEAPASCVFASSHAMPLLAAGTLAAPGVLPSLSILRTSTGGGEYEIFSAVDCFPSPAAFRSVSWSRASKHISAAGFVAGGLDNGMVAVWDSKIVRDDAVDDSGDQSLQGLQEDYFANTRAPASHKSQEQPVAVVVEEEDDGFFDVAREMNQSTGRSVVYGSEALKPACISKKRGNVVKTKSPATKDDEAVAVFQHHNKSAVHSLSFNYVHPHLLASAAGDQIILWDLSYTGADTVGVWEHVSSSPMKTTCVSWSTSPNTFGCTSYDGVISLFDIREKSPLSSTYSWKRPCNCIQFNPQEENELVISFCDSSDDHSVLSWDLRSMKTPVWKSCDYSGGTNSLSWSNMDDLILVSTNNCKLNILSSHHGKIISELTAETPCLDLTWSNMVRGSFFASFDRKLIAYALE